MHVVASVQSLQCRSKESALSLILNTSIFSIFSIFSTFSIFGASDEEECLFPSIFVALALKLFIYTRPFGMLRKMRKGLQIVLSWCSGWPLASFAFCRACARAPVKGTFLCRFLFVHKFQFWSSGCSKTLAVNLILEGFHDEKNIDRMFDGMMIKLLMQYSFQWSALSTAAEVEYEFRRALDQVVSESSYLPGQSFLISPSCKCCAMNRLIVVLFPVSWTRTWS